MATRTIVGVNGLKIADLGIRGEVDDTTRGVEAESQTRARDTSGPLRPRDIKLGFDVVWGANLNTLLAAMDPGGDTWDLVAITPAGTTASLTVTTRAVSASSSPPSIRSGATLH